MTPDSKHRHRAALLLAVVVFLSRLPWLSSGLGDDPDGYRVSIAVRHLAASGQYIPSRPPGYPLPEYLGALLARVFPPGPLLLNLPSAAASAIASYVLVLMLARFGLRRAAIVAAAFSFTPAVYKASSLPLDYMVGFMFFALAMYAASEKRNLGLAAVCLGLAAACRPTYALAIIPVALALREGLGFARPTTAEVWRFLRLSVLSGVTAVLFYAPLFLRSGLAWLTFSDHGIDIARLVLHGTVDLFGIAGLLSLVLVGLEIVLRRSFRLGTLLDDRLGLALLACSLVYLILFLRLPDQPYYLIPALPGFYLAIARSVPGRSTAILCAGMVVSSFLGSIEQDPSGTVHLRLAGPLARRVTTEARWACVAAKVAEHLSADGDSPVVASYLGPVILASEPALPARRVVYLVTSADGGLRTNAGLPIASASTFIIDMAVRAQQRFAPEALSRLTVIETRSCAGASASEAS